MLCITLTTASHSYLPQRKETGDSILNVWFPISRLLTTDFAESDSNAKFQELVILESLVKALVDHSPIEPEDLEALLSRYQAAAKAMPFDEG